MGGYDEHTPHIYTTTHTTEEHIIGLTYGIYSVIIAVYGIYYIYTVYINTATFTSTISSS